MKRIACLLAVLSTAVASARDEPTTRPALGPTVDVCVQPFRPLDPSGSLGWAGRAVQQTLLADLSRAGLHPQSADAPALTTDDACAAARAAGAKYVVTGTYQWVDPDLRLTGQLLDAATGTAVGGLSATGPGKDLFALEDRLSDQLVEKLHAMPTPAAPPPAAPPAVARPVPAALQPAALAATIAPPAAGHGSAYQGSALQAYVDANRSPSVDYTQQVIDARDRNTFGSYNAGSYGGFGYGGVGYGGFGNGGFGYGGGYGGFGYGGYGGYLLGISYPVGSVGTFGYGGYGSTGFGGGFGGGGFATSLGSGAFHGSVGYGGRGR